jgi:hypothetical protein
MLLSWSDQRVQLHPSDDAGLFQFLLKTVQEWQFLLHMSQVGQLDPTDSRLKGATLIRNDAVDMWNEWMASKMGHEWFRVTRRVVLDDDFVQPEKDIYLTAGEHVLTTRHCEGVMAATIIDENILVQGPSGSKQLLFEEEKVELQCVSPPPENRLNIIPFHEAVNVEVLD